MGWLRCAAGLLGVDDDQRAILEPVGIFRFGNMRYANWRVADDVRPEQLNPYRHQLFAVNHVQSGYRVRIVQIPRGVLADVMSRGRLQPGYRCSFDCRFIMLLAKLPGRQHDNKQKDADQGSHCAQTNEAVGSVHVSLLASALTNFYQIVNNCANNFVLGVN